ncbi:sulfatase family protein [Phocaeicola barnesiae]|jgi:arylsulfatase A|uniref:Arylsulfatase n=2 Tax=Phocaeicola barnesiae TaxID=376804 RepID=A0AAW5N9V8_9BACT|nr:arylsulfatase [Phocaeicola barnesiae]MBS6468471.1 arylsulfatase [Bacteroides sp.]CDD33996.1 arylsulfatase A [Bacteroides sp. CAG:714]MCF2598458.1 arylsulfatase [Phocaeicola barnesiae]MCR8873719.1 arylsulfatase [Phocaeicola barnesiae]HJG77755.1 arylsulfatase [Phocaeicola barnesiae]
MKNVFLATAAILSLLSCTEKQKQPNIIFILADDMGYGDVSYFDNNSKLKTENLDRMAQEGVVFTDAHSSSSVSTPTRYGILTGRYNWRSTLKNNVLYGYDKALIPADRETMASMLRKNGYTTAGIGKWHLGWDWDNIDAGKDKVDFSKPVQNGPTTRGFDYFYGFCGSLDMAPYVYIENDMPTSLPDRETVNEGKYSWWRKGPTGADFVHEEVLPNLVDRACNYIKEKAKADQPYFLYLPLPAPHTPILPTEEFRGKSGIGEYGDFVLMVDAMVGKVLQAVKESGEDGNTIVVFTTDNGCSPAAGIKEMEAQGHRPNSIYRGHKADLFDGGHRIPCILRWPEGTKPHEVRQTVCLTDFYATFAAINGYKLMDSEGEDSYNLLPAIVSETEIDPIREATVHHSIDGQFTIRQGDWKLLLSASSGGWSAPTPTDTLALDSLPPIQLYNMKDDPSETTNVEAEHPEIVSRLRALMAKYVREGRSTPGAPQKNDGEYPWKELDWMKE